MMPANQDTPFDVLARALSKTSWAGPADAALLAVGLAKEGYTVVEHRPDRNLVRLDHKGAYVTHAMLLTALRGKLAEARADLAAACRARKLKEPDHHFRGLPECPRVIAAYDAVRAAEGEVAKLEREGRRA